MGSVTRSAGARLVGLAALWRDPVARALRVAALGHLVDWRKVVAVVFDVAAHRQQRGVAAGLRVLGLAWRGRLRCSRSGAQHAPLDVGAQLLARHLTIGQALNDWAVLGGDTAPLVFPLRDGGSCDAEGGSKGCLRPNDPGGAVDGVFHDR